MSKITVETRQYEGSYGYKPPIGRHGRWVFALKAGKRAGSITFNGRYDDGLTVAKAAARSQGFDTVSVQA